MDSVKKEKNLGVDYQIYKAVSDYIRNDPDIKVKINLAVDQVIQNINAGLENRLNNELSRISLNSYYTDYKINAMIKDAVNKLVADRIRSGLTISLKAEKQPKV